MRPIKFRGRELLTGRLVYSEFLGLPRFFKLLDDGDIELIGQFTGLKDFHGKEIYEGDVVNTDGIVKEVVFEKWLPGFIGLVSYPGEIEVDEKKIEVIGNIYENPELLK